MTPEEWLREGERAAKQRIERASNEKLTELNLSYLNLKELLLEIVKCTHLTRLDLSKNQMTSIPEVIGQLSNLTLLDLTYNKITWALLIQGMNQLFA
jgi:Leucine-rich repeat (LRR) protein